MFDSIHSHIMAGYNVPIDFTKQGWRQFAKLNCTLGSRYLRAFILKRDVAEYIAAHEAAGVKLDTECQELRYQQLSVGHWRKAAAHPDFPHGGRQPLQG